MLTPNLTYALVCKVFFARFFSNCFVQYKDYEEIKSEHFNLQEANAYLIYIKTLCICQLKDDISVI